jgi:osmotically-inducible protein OsmY
MKKLVMAAMLAVMTAAIGTGCSVTSGQEHVGEYVDDATITTRVKSRFAEDKTVAATRISVETLKGFATTEAEKQRAAQIAASVPGVKQVQNAVVVRAPMPAS